MVRLAATMVRAQPSSIVNAESAEETPGEVAVPERRILRAKNDVGIQRGPSGINSFCVMNV